MLDLVFSTLFHILKKTFQIRLEGGFVTFVDSWNKSCSTVDNLFSRPIKITFCPDEICNGQFDGLIWS